MTRVAILQSNYIPWKGYFDIIGSVDVFVVYDDVQYSKNHWHNRNKIKTPSGSQWVTIPVSKENGSFQNIDEIAIAKPFARKHHQTIEQNYRRAPFYPLYESDLKRVYSSVELFDRLSEVNILFLEEISRLLGFRTRFVRSTGLSARGGRTERLIGICRELGATTYLTGPSAADYLDVGLFAAEEIRVEWMDYGGYPTYPQLYGEFDHAVSILDLLMNTGPDARAFMKAPRMAAGALP